MLFDLAIRNRLRVFLRGSANGFGDDKTVPRGMEIYATVADYIYLAIPSLADENRVKLLTRDTPIPSNLVTITAPVTASQM